MLKKKSDFKIFLIFKNKNFDIKKKIKNILGFIGTYNNIFFK